MNCSKTLSTYLSFAATCQLFGRGQIDRIFCWNGSLHQIPSPGDSSCRFKRLRPVIIRIFEVCRAKRGAFLGVFECGPMSLNKLYPFLSNLRIKRKLVHFDTSRVTCVLEASLTRPASNTISATFFLLGLSWLSFSHF